MYRYSFSCRIYIFSLLLFLSPTIFAGTDYVVDGSIIAEANGEINNALKDIDEPDIIHIKKVEEILKDYGYFNGTVSKDDDDIMLIIKPGNRFKIGEITYTNLNILSPSKANKLIDIREGDRFDREIVETSLSELLKYYLERGYIKTDIHYEVVILNESEREVKLSITVDEGDEYRLWKLNVYGNHHFTDEEVRDILGFKEAEVIDIEDVYIAVNRLKSSYIDEGFTDADVELWEMELDDGKVNLSISIVEESRLIIGKVEIKGNEKTRDYVILHKLQLFPGDIYRDENREKSLRNLMQLKLFRTISDITIKDDGDVTVEVEEGRYISIFGGVGYQPSLSTKSGGLFGEFRGRFSNIGGTARSLLLNWSGSGSDEIYASLTYREPFLLGRDIYSDVVTEFEKREDYRKYEISMGVGTYPGTHLELEVGGGLSRIMKLSGYNNSHEFIYISEEIDTTNNLTNPRSGLVLTAREEFGVMRGDTPTNYRRSDIKLELDIKKYISLHKNVILLMRLMGKALFLQDSALYKSELFYLGGATTLRGYQEHAFSGERVALGTLEIRFPIMDETYLYGFFDEGYHYLRSKTLQEGFHSGYGVGISLGTSIGPLRLEYALGSGGIGDGVIHLSIGDYY